MDSTPFAEDGKLVELGVEIVDSPDEADCIVGRRKYLFKPDAVRPGKFHLLWTHEPFFDVTPTFMEFLHQKHFGRGCPLFIFNAHSGLIYTDNYYYGPTGQPLSLLRGEQDLNVGFSDKLITFVASFKKFDALVDGSSISLYATRQNLALELHQLGRLRLIGRGWPEGVSEGESRYVKGALDAKHAFLAHSNFTLAYENCISDYYVTEKIWQGIQGGCLPIYFANDTIYQAFPSHSFIDGSQFKTAEQLGEFVEAMPVHEYIRRVNVCREVYNYALARRFRGVSRRHSMLRLKRFLESMKPPALSIAENAAEAAVADSVD
ncbi:hypothetical protein IHQ68_10825 [Chelatococcus sambhunathii]|uniref:Fucosyltransferase C-terminal domain-containing protein n=1 Tax=Chelatococcus sambhunathii TaxID=363953 RepID=A0ABU1DG78_9HYPH|nr:glycosyltransferase family 10 [Chelatococcus sambhunathii]MDR4307112.1 hypothetical protein [Chelatococcus sambhunathii]